MECTTVALARLSTNLKKTQTVTQTEREEEFRRKDFKGERERMASPPSRSLSFSITKLRRKGPKPVPSRFVDTELEDKI